MAAQRLRARRDVPAAMQELAAAAATATRAAALALGARRRRRGRPARAHAAQLEADGKNGAKGAHGDPGDAQAPSTRPAWWSAATCPAARAQRQECQRPPRRRRHRRPWPLGAPAQEGGDAAEHGGERGAARARQLALTRHDPAQPERALGRHRRAPRRQARPQGIARHAAALP